MNRATAGFGQGINLPPQVLNREKRDDPHLRGLPRVTVNPAVMAGKPCVRGMRVTVGMVLGELGAGTTIDRLLELYPYLGREDILEALRFGAWPVRFREVEYPIPRRRGHD